MTGVKRGKKGDRFQARENARDLIKTIAGSYWLKNRLECLLHDFFLTNSRDQQTQCRYLLTQGLSWKQTTTKLLPKSREGTTGGNPEDYLSFPEFEKANKTVKHRV